MTYFDKFKDQTRISAQRNWRGTTNLDLVAALQQARDNIEDLTESPNGCPDLIPLNLSWYFPGSRDEAIALSKHYYTCVVDSALQEIKRRQSIYYTPGPSLDKEIIAAIKEAVPVATVLEWYTRVIIPRGSYRGNWQFQCRLHGTDAHPSGIVYIKEQRWHCFGCDKGGDVFDAVMAYEKLTLSQAIAKLARYAGLDTKPLFKQAIPKVKGGAVL